MSTRRNLGRRRRSAGLSRKWRAVTIFYRIPAWGAAGYDFRSVTGFMPRSRSYFFVLGEKSMFRNRWFVLALVLVLTAGLLMGGVSAEGEEAVRSTVCANCAGTGADGGEECGDCSGSGVITSTSNMAFTFWALVPPLVAIALALITKEV